MQKMPIYLLYVKGMYGEPKKKDKAKEYKHMTFYLAAQMAKEANVTNSVAYAIFASVAHKTVQDKVTNCLAHFRFLSRQYFRRLILAKDEDA